MKKYTDPRDVMWDAWFVTRGDMIHAFYLKNGALQGESAPEDWGVGHAVSADGLHWETLPSVLPRLENPADPTDYCSKFTGCAVNRDDVCYLFYTMRDMQGQQRIGLALSEDWVHFERYPGNPVLDNDPSVLIGFANKEQYDWNIVDCRDLVVVEDGDGGYYGYWAAAADLGGLSPVGVIAMARSRDLLHWEDQRIVYAVDHHGIIEVPDVFSMDGRWYLTALTGRHYSGRGFAAEDGIVSGTVIAVSDSPAGPFTDTGDLLIAGPAQSGFTCRSVMHRGRRLLWYIDHAAQGTALSLPKVLRVENGRLAAAYALPESGRRLLPIPEKWEKLPTGFAWRTFGGTLETGDGVYTLRTLPRDYHMAGFAVDAGSAEWDVTLSVTGIGGGLLMETDGGLFALLAEPSASRLLLCRLHTFETVAVRAYPFAENTPYHLRCLLVDGVIEVYVEDVLLLQCGLPCRRVCRLGLIADRGTVTLHESRLYEL